MMSYLRKLEHAFRIVGIGLLTIYLGAMLRGEVLSRLALRQFKGDQIAAQGDRSPASPDFSGAERTGGIDFSLWSVQRISAYERALLAKVERPLVVLAIPRLSLEVPVFEGTDDLTLNRGAGRIVGTARPGEAGNMGIAAHRDGFFRSLKDIRQGDEIDLRAAFHKTIYMVDNIEVVKPDDVRILRSRAHPSLTLVTCYPFYFVGSAPNRYIVQASLKDPRQAKIPDPQSAIQKKNKEDTP
jgi:sortase A